MGDNGVNGDSSVVPNVFHFQPTCFTNFILRCSCSSTARAHSSSAIFSIMKIGNVCNQTKIVFNLYQSMSSV